MPHGILHNIRMIWVHTTIILLAVGSWWDSIFASSPAAFGTSGTSSAVSVILNSRDLQLVLYENGALLLKNHVRGADSWCIVKGTLYTMLVWLGLVVESIRGVRLVVEEIGT